MDRRLPTTKPFTCGTCEFEIAGSATFHVGSPFCCAGCVAGGPCTCSYDSSAKETAIRHCLDIESGLGDPAATQHPEQRPAGRPAGGAGSR